LEEAGFGNCSRHVGHIAFRPTNAKISFHTCAAAMNAAMAPGDTHASNGGPGLSESLLGLGVKRATALVGEVTEQRRTAEGAVL
jgi:hypothetical protein